MISTSTLQLQCITFVPFFFFFFTNSVLRYGMHLKVKSMCTHSTFFPFCIQYCWKYPSIKSGSLHVVLISCIISKVVQSQTSATDQTYHIARGKTKYNMLLPLESWCKLLPKLSCSFISGCFDVCFGCIYVLCSVMSFHHRFDMLAEKITGMVPE